MSDFNFPSISEHFLIYNFITNICAEKTLLKVLALLLRIGDDINSYFEVNSHHVENILVFVQILRSSFLIHIGADILFVVLNVSESDF